MSTHIHTHTLTLTCIKYLEMLIPTCIYIIIPKYMHLGIKVLIESGNGYIIVPKYVHLETEELIVSFYS